MSVVVFCVCAGGRPKVIAPKAEQIDWHEPLQGSGLSTRAETVQRACRMVACRVCRGSWGMDEDPLDRRGCPEPQGCPFSPKGEI